MQQVVVIGGGPAGASFAARMAELGFDVVLIERSAFPRPALGESLSPGVATLLQATGAWQAVASARFHTAGDVHVTWSGAETEVKAGTGGLLVDRGRLDAILLEAAMARGVRVLQPARIVAQREEGAGFTLCVAHDGGEEAIAADFIADARGRAGLAAGPRRATGQRTLALYAYWRGAGLPPHATLAAGHDGWAWGLPLPGGRYNAQLFVSPKDARATGCEPLTARYRRMIDQSALGRILAGAQIEGEVRATDATAWLSEEPISPRKIRLGDAALALDPISSSGVQKALQTALSAAIVANTLLRRPSASIHAQGFYRQSLASAAMRHAAWAGAHYAEAARGRADSFWSARALPPDLSETAEAVPRADEPVCLSPDARLAETPCLGAEYVELRQALIHPCLEEPVAFLANQPVAKLLSGLPSGSLLGIAEGWARSMPLPTALAIASWLRRRGVLVNAGVAA